jgi:TonB family protein
VTTPFATENRDDIVYRIGQGVKQPIVLEKPEPSYTEEAREARVNGTVKLEVVIRKNGIVSNIKVIKSLGFGLDEAVVQTISTRWRFKPGTLNNEPVNTMGTIEVNFEIH